MKQFSILFRLRRSFIKMFNVLCYTYFHMPYPLFHSVHEYSSLIILDPFQYNILVHVMMRQFRRLGLRNICNNSELLICHHLHRLLMEIRSSIVVMPKEIQFVFFPSGWVVSFSVLFVSFISLRISIGLKSNFSYYILYFVFSLLALLLSSLINCSFTHIL